MQQLFVAAALVLCGVVVSGLDNGLARTPPMGWLDWERFRCNMDCVKDPDNCISENLFKQMADIIVAEGYKDVGYEYVGIDDCWLAESRDQDGKLVPHPQRFPSGIKALADYMHARGLKLGIYEDFGSKTCAGYPGSEFHMQLDAQTFADWGVDMVKFDGCNSDPEDMDWGYPVMSFYLNKTGRPMLFSCGWPVYQRNHGISPNYTAVAQYCNTWRAYRDIQDRWDSLNEIISFWGDNQGDFIEHVGPGSFSDPDMIIVGDFGLSYDQQRVQMGMWAMLAAPLLMSNDLRKIDNRSKALLQNRRVIALNQDPLGVAASRVMVKPLPKTREIELWGNDSLWGNFSFWVKPLASPNGSFAIAVFNSDWHGMPLQTTFTFSELGLESAGAYNVTEVFDGAAVGVFPASKQIELYVNPPGIVLWIAEPVSGMTVNRGDASVVVIG